MDPNAAYVIMQDPDEDADVRTGAAIALSEWIERGGFCTDEMRAAVTAHLDAWRAGVPR